MPDPGHWRACLAHFLDSLSSRSGSQYTAAHYRAVLLRFFGDFSRSPESMSRADVEAFVGAPNTGRIRHGQSPSAATRKFRLAVLSSFYKYAVTYTYTDEQGQPQRMMTTAPPTLGMHAPIPTLAPRGISYVEMERLFSVIPGDLRGTRDKTVFLVLFWSLRRREELLRLVRGDFSQVTFSGGRVGWVYRFRRKGGSTVDDRAEMPDQAMRIILRYVALSDRDWNAMTASEPIFLAIPPPQMKISAYTPPIAARGDTLAKRLKAYLKLAELDPRISLHSFRHAGSQARYEAGQDIRSIQHALRHSSLATTDLYLRILVGTEDESPMLLKERYGKLGEG